MNEAQRAQFEHFARGKGLSVELDHRFASLIGVSPYIDVVTHQAWLDWQVAYAAGAAAENEACAKIAGEWHILVIHPDGCRHEDYMTDLAEAIRARQEQGKEKP